MISGYKGSYKFEGLFISTISPEKRGVYYCGFINSTGTLSVLYVGSSTRSIKSRLLGHFRNRSWPEVTHFGFKTTTSTSEAVTHEKGEIIRLNPKYNVRQSY